MNKIAEDRYHPNMHRLCYMLISCCLTGNVYGNDSIDRVSIQSESMENGSAVSLGIYSDGIFYGGVSINYISSSEVIQHGNRKTISPAYIVMGFRAPGKISPYIEAGMDLPEALIDDVVNNKDDSVSHADYFFAAGLEFSINDKFSISLYAKKYKFKFREYSLAPVTRVTPYSYGMGLTIHL